MFLLSNNTYIDDVRDKVLCLLSPTSLTFSSNTSAAQTAAYGFIIPGSDNVLENFPGAK